MLGWIKIYDYKGATLPITVDQRVYSPAQLSIAQLFANWMQASYLPTGALGDVRQIVSEKLGPYNQNTAALPQSYGAFAKLYTELKYGVNKKLEPLTTATWSGPSRPTGSTGFPPTPSARRSTTTSRCRPSRSRDTATTRESGRRLTPSGAGTVSRVLHAELRDRQPQVRPAVEGPSAPVRDDHQRGISRRRGRGHRPLAQRGEETDHRGGAGRSEADRHRDEDAPTNGPRSGWRCSKRTGRSTGIACRKLPRSRRTNLT